MNPTTSQDALSQLQGFQSSRRKPQDILKESQARLGIPTVQQRQVGLRTAIGNTENLIRDVEPSVSGRTGGSLVTNAQKSRLVQLERAPLDETFRTQSQALQGEEANLSTLERNALQEAQLATSADDQRQNELQGIYSILYQREADDRARQEREAAAAEARRAAQAQTDLMSSLYGGGGAGGGEVAPVVTAPNPMTDATERATRIISGGIQAQAASYSGLVNAASRGDSVAQQTLAVLDRLKPGLKNSYKNIIATGLGNEAQGVITPNKVQAPVTATSIQNPLRTLGAIGSGIRGLFR